MAEFWAGTVVELCGWTGFASFDSSCSVIAGGKGDTFGSSLISTGAKTAVIGPRGFNGSVARESSVVAGSAFFGKGMGCAGGVGGGSVAPPSTAAERAPTGAVCAITWASPGPSPQFHAVRV